MTNRRKFLGIAAGAVAAGPSAAKATANRIVNPGFSVDGTYPETGPEVAWVKQFDETYELKNKLDLLRQAIGIHKPTPIDDFQHPDSLYQTGQANIEALKSVSPVAKIRMVNHHNRIRDRQAQRACAIRHLYYEHDIYPGQIHTTYESIKRLLGETQ